MITSSTTQNSSVAQRQRWNLILLAIMYAGYVAFMLCRNTLIAASPAMIKDPNLGLDLESYGQLASWSSAGAIAGKLTTGIAADLFGGRRLFLFGLLFTAGSTAAFGAVSSLTSLKTLNFTGQFFKASGWPAMAKLIGHWYAPNQHGRTWSIISTSSRVGTIAALLLVGSLLSYATWRSAFFLTGGIAIAAVILGYFLLKERPQDVGLAPLQEYAVDSHAHPLDGTTLWQACFAFATSVRVWLICMSIGCLCILVDFITFIPIYLNQSLAIPEDKAAMSSTSFLVGMFVALIAASVFYDRFTKHQLAWVMGSLLTLSCGCVLLLWSFPALELPETAKTPITILTLFVFGLSIATAYYIPMSIFSIAFGGPHSGFLIAMIDIFGYAATLIFTYFGGTIAQDHGWTVFLRTLLTIAILATISMTAFLWLDAKADAKEKGSS